MLGLDFQSWTTKIAAKKGQGKLILDQSNANLKQLDQYGLTFESDISDKREKVNNVDDAFSAGHALDVERPCSKRRQPLK